MASTTQSLITEIKRRFHAIEGFQYGQLAECITEVVQERVTTLPTAQRVMTEITSDPKMLPKEFDGQIIGANWLESLQQFIMQVLYDFIDRTDKRIQQLESFNPHGP